jgi:hypothetical protein
MKAAKHSRSPMFVGHCRRFQLLLLINYFSSSKVDFPRKPSPALQAITNLHKKEIYKNEISFYFTTCANLKRLPLAH